MRSFSSFRRLPKPNDAIAVYFFSEPFTREKHWFEDSPVREGKVVFLAFHLLDNR